MSGRERFFRPQLDYNLGITRPMDLSSVPANDLATLCRDAHSSEAWNEFVRRFQRPIALVVLRTARSWGAPSSAVVDDLIQETFLRLCENDCRLLKNFSAREPDSIYSYLKVIASSVTHDHFRAEKSAKRGGLLDRVEGEDGDLSFLSDPKDGADAIEQAVHRSEIDRVLLSFIPNTITERDRVIFWLYFEQGFSARDIARVAGVGLGVKGVESSIHRSSAQLRAVMQPQKKSPARKGFSVPSTIFRENG